MTMRRLGTAIAIAFAACITACSQVAGVDVHYQATADGGGGDGGDGGAVATEGGVIGQEGGAGAACPCDATQGLGCCLPKGKGTPYCAPNDGACESASGIFLACTSSDPSTESVCCWSTTIDGGSTPTTAALAWSCGTRPQSCLSDMDCVGGAKCHVSPCEGISIGVCGDGVAPLCPVSP